jgi:glycosyltransferase involved in cell wall biosynthesis
MAGELPSVSFLVPTYNRARFLPQSIDSVLSQEYPDLELIVIDDGSTDGTAGILERYTESHPGRFRFERREHAGQAASVNRGFELARGELVSCFNDDDVLLPGAVRKVATALVEDPDAVLAYPGWHFVNEDGEILDTCIPIEHSIVESVRLMDWIVGPGHLFRASLVEQVGGWDERLPQALDWDFYLRVAPLGPFRRVPEPLVLWRQHRDRYGGREGHGPEHARQYVEVLDRVYSGEVSPELEDVKVQAYRNAYILAAWASGPGMNGPGERFYVADRHWRAIHDRAGKPDDLDAEIAELRTANWRVVADNLRLKREVAARDEHIERLEAQREELSEFLERPWWWHARRRIARSRLRPRRRRTRPE